MVRTITPQNFFDILLTQEQPTIIDIRPKEQFTQWSLYDSLHIPINGIEHNKTVRQSDSIILICNDGKESQRTATALSKTGISAVALAGGLKAWSKTYDIVPIEEKHSTLNVYQCKRLLKGCLSYIIVLPDHTSAIIIDPTSHTNIYDEFLKKNNLKVIAVVDTHIHADHVSGARKLAKQYAIPYLLPKASKVDFPFIPIEETLQSIAVGATIRCIHTPGHTQESISLLFDDIFLFSGDTLCIDAISRTDPGEDSKTAPKKLFHSINSILFELKERIHVLPAHATQALVPGPIRSATLRYVKLFNPIKSFSNSTQFSEFIMKKSFPKPPNYSTIQKLNRDKNLPRGIHIDQLELGGNFCAIAHTE